MKLSRRRSLHLAVGAAAIPTVSRISWAQSYPARPVHWIVCFSPGGPNDIVARVIGQYLSDHLGQQFIIENRVGAGGNVGMQSALSATPDRRQAHQEDGTGDERARPLCSAQNPIGA